MKRIATFLALATVASAQSPTDAPSNRPTFDAPIRLEADGEPIDIAELSKFAHAGPTLADVDGDGTRDLVVGDFPGYFWLFENEGTDEKPKFKRKGKLQAGKGDAQTPVY